MNRSIIEDVLTTHFTKGTYRIKSMNEKFYCDFGTYSLRVCKNFCIRNKETGIFEFQSLDPQVFVPLFKTAFEKLNSKAKTLSIWISLQMCIQPLLEEIVLKDRVEYLKEKNVKTKLIPLFDGTLSPRNIAIVGIKSHK